MDSSVQSMNSEARNVQPVPMEEKNTVEIVVHVTEELAEDQRDSLVTALKNTSGISDAVFCPLRYHLMLVNYDRQNFSSLEVLESIRSQDIHAQLIGPI
jgi:hypothetical protein